MFCTVAFGRGAEMSRSVCGAAPRPRVLSLGVRDLPCSHGGATRPPAAEKLLPGMRTLVDTIDLAAASLRARHPAKVIAAAGLEPLNPAQAAQAIVAE